MQITGGFVKISPMTENDDEYLQFWEGRYAKHLYEWGQKPSPLAFKVAEHVLREGTVMDVACGYGRDTIYLARAGYRAYGMDLSGLAIKRAMDWAKREELHIDFKQGELIDCDYKQDFFDAVIMFNTLHLLWGPKRVEVVSEIHRILKPGGVGLFAFFSTKEKGFGKGREVEKNSFARGGSRMRLYFDRMDIEELFSAYSHLSAEEFFISPKDHEHHGRDEHGHHEWLTGVIK